MKIGIVGNGADKFSEAGAERARQTIRALLRLANTTHVVSGHSPRGGVDIWAEEIGKELGLILEIKAPKSQSWAGPYGYRARNWDIARTSDIVYVVVADAYPEGYKGQRFKVCYHCAAEKLPAGNHVKSGACWTAIQARKIGKVAEWCVIANA